MSQPVIAQEQQRHQYLAALGISSWLPRTSLPQAAPSAGWVEDFQYPNPAQAPEFEDAFTDDGFEAGLQPTSAPQPAQRPQNARQARAALSASLNLELDKKPAKAAVTPEPAAAKVQVQARTAPAAEVPLSAPIQAPAPAPGEVPRFKLAFMRYGDLLVVDSVPPQSSAGFSVAHQRLLHNIVRALELKLPEPLPEPDLFFWPVFVSPSLEPFQSLGEAHKAVQYKLDQLLSQAPARGVLLCGAASAEMALQQEAADGMRGVLFSLRSGTKALAVASLTEVMNLPDAKAELWYQLQPLRQHLKSA